MIYIVIALMAEAKPVVKYFSLKKDEDSHKFLVYSSDEITLVISGTGMLSSAVATSFLAGRYVADAESSPIINLGICGARKDYYPTGTLISCNKITDNQTGRSFYPDLMLSHNFPEDSILTFSSPVLSEIELKKGFNIVDMEAAGFAHAAFSFFPPQNIYCLKIVSDYLDKPALDKEFVSSLVSSGLDSIRDFMESAKNIAAINNDVFTSCDYDFLEQLVLH